MKKSISVFIFFFILGVSLILTNGFVSISYLDASSLNGSTFNVNLSGNFTETDPFYFSNPLGYYNETTLPSTDLTGYAQYNFLSNNFSGTGDFTTTGDVTASNLFADTLTGSLIDGSTIETTLSGAGTTGVNGEYIFGDHTPPQHDSLYLYDAYLMGTINEFGYTYFIVTPDSVVVDKYSPHLTNPIPIYDTLDDSYVYVGQMFKSNPGNYNGFVDYYRMLYADFLAGTGTWEITDGVASVPSGSYMYEQLSPFKLDETGLTTQLAFRVLDRQIGIGEFSVNNAEISSLNVGNLDITNENILINPETYPEAQGYRLMWMSDKQGAFRAGSAGKIGIWNEANVGSSSAAFGVTNEASGFASTAFNQGNTASGSASLAGIFNSVASGNYATAIGTFALADAYEMFAVGAFNTGGGNPTSWVETDPIFQIGIGTGNVVTNIRKDALTVYKNGNVNIHNGNLSITGNTKINGNLNTTGTIYYGALEANSPHALLEDESGHTRICMKSTDGKTVYKTIQNINGSYEAVYIEDVTGICDKTLLKSRNVYYEYVTVNEVPVILEVEENIYEQIWTKETNIEKIETIKAYIGNYEVGFNYSQGDLFKYPIDSSTVYEVLSEHVSQSDWKPDTTPSLYKLKIFHEYQEITDWVQPLGSHDCYPIDSIVIHKENKWKNIIECNVWEPTVHGWEVVS